MTVSSSFSRISSLYANYIVVWNFSNEIHFFGGIDDQLVLIILEKACHKN